MSVLGLNFTYEFEVCFTVISEYHKMDTNKYLNIFECHIMYRTNIRIYLNATYLPNEYLNIFVLYEKEH